jgi:hypothetical protein
LGTGPQIVVLEDLLDPCHIQGAQGRTAADQGLGLQGDDQERNQGAAKQERQQQEQTNQVSKQGEHGST